jgi:hypothetical protein
MLSRWDFSAAAGQSPAYVGALSDLAVGMPRARFRALRGRSFLLRRRWRLLLAIYPKFEYANSCNDLSLAALSHS